MRPGVRGRLVHAVAQARVPIHGFRTRTDVQNEDFDDQRVVLHRHVQGYGHGVPVFVVVRCRVRAARADERGDEHDDSRHVHPANDGPGRVPPAAVHEHRRRSRTDRVPAKVRGGLPGQRDARFPGDARG